MYKEKTTTQELQVNGVLKLPNNNWIIDSNKNLTNNQKIYFDNGAKTYFKAAEHLHHLYQMGLYLEMDRQELIY